MYDFAYMTFSKRQNYCDKEQVSGSQELGIGRCDYKGITWDVSRNNRTVPYSDCSGGYMILYIY